MRDRTWIEQQWDAARLMARDSKTGALLVLDEVQKVSDWSTVVKLLWDADTHAGLPLKVVLLGSAPLLIQRGLTESLAGRFEVIAVPHWSFAESRHDPHQDAARGNASIWWGERPREPEFTRLSGSRGHSPHPSQSNSCAENNFSAPRVSALVKIHHVSETCPMPITLDQIVEETRELPGAVVAELIDRIMVARHGGIEPSVAESWKAETDRRIAEIESGKVKGVLLEESLARARKIAGL
jgi:hypothetical protein